MQVPRHEHFPGKEPRDLQAQGWEPLGINFFGDRTKVPLTASEPQQIVHNRLRFVR
jgi:hypothetical protein